MSNMDLTAANAALKEYYDGQLVQNLVYEDNPLLAMIPKKTNIGGKLYPVPIQTGVSQGGSAVFATAQANQSPATLEQFAITRKRYYSIATLDRETMLASETSTEAFIDAASVVINGAIQKGSLTAATSLFGSGTGSIGSIGAISSGVVTLSDPEDVVKFEVGMVLQANATDGGASPRAALGYVVAVNRNTGKFTVSTSAGGSAATPSGWTTGDFVLEDGNNNGMFSGLDAWLPETDPTSSDNFYGVNRSVDRDRLAGVFYDGSGQAIEEALIDGSRRLAREGASADYVFMNYLSFAALEKSLGSKVQYVDLAGPAGIGFKGIQVTGAKRPMKVVPDRSNPTATAFMLDMKTWSLLSLREVPHVIDDGPGGEWLRVYNQDAAEIRVAYYANVACNAPGRNARVKLAV